MRQSQSFLDLDLNFLKHPVLKDVSVRFNDLAIKGAIKNLILTMNYERPFHSEIGSRIGALLFEPITPVLWGMIKMEVTNLITTFEPRVNLLDVIVTYQPDDNTVNIMIAFEIIGTSTTSNLQVTLDRTR